MSFKQIGWKRLIIVVSALTIIVTSLLFTNNVAENIAEAEKQKMQIWAEATEQLLGEGYSDLAFFIIEQNNSIPVIVVDKEGNVITYRNIEPPKVDREKFFEKEVQRISKLHEPIVIEIGQEEVQYLYYDNSLILKYLKYYPILQGVLIIMFLTLLIWAFRVEKKREEEKVWVGLSKETAHQLGTPISSLAAWQEILKATVPSQTVEEMGKDVDRLKTIAERFSKVGSAPKLEMRDIREVVEASVRYMKGRTSQRVVYEINDNAETREVMISEPLIQWVLENLSKNAVDAMEGEGRLTFNILNEDGKVVVEVSDTGKGMEKKMYKRIFEPGFTTKKRGWGLGLSLAKRIVTEYHKGRIFVKQSEVGRGTTFRIELR
ncbi:MAG: ATP-binding protein [Paludibacteraceae bacterium]|nr:ATP-binding protein [Paludibacteraceae bacterium]